MRVKTRVICLCFIKVQRGRDTLGVDFCSITTNGGLDNDILQQRLHAVAKKRVELQNMELELRAHVIARSEIVGLQNTYDAQIKEHANATVKLQVFAFLVMSERYINEICIVNIFFFLAEAKM